MYRQGGIVLVPLPFSDLTSNKKRPVLIISSNRYNSLSEDIIVTAITSNIRGIEFEIVFNNDDLDEGELLKTSCARADKIYTLSKNIIIKKFGKIQSNKLKVVLEKVNEIISQV